VIGQRLDSISLPLPRTRVRIVGWTRLLDKTTLFLLILVTLIIMVTWLSFAAQAQVAAIEARTRAIETESSRLKMANVQLLERISRVLSFQRLSTEAAHMNYAYPRWYDWEIMARE